MRPTSPFPHNFLAALILCGAVGLPACALSPKLQQWEADYYWTERLYMDGQYALAQQRFAALRKLATDPRDADEAALMECQAQTRAEQFAPATACYDALATSAAEKPMRARAVLHAAELRFYNLHLEKDGLSLWQALVEKSTDEPAALRALDHLYLYGELDAAKRDKMVETFVRLEQRDADSEIADNLLLRSAMLLEQDGRPDALRRAAALLERQEQRHPEDATIMDCLVTRARIYGKLGELKLEARDLERVIRTYETSYIFASYGSSDHRLASLRLVELYRGPLLDLDRAAFHIRNLPEMLRMPVKMPAYLITAAEIEEQKGNRIRAVSTYRSVLAYVTQRNKDFRKNDQRICSEQPTEPERQQCLADIGTFSDVEPKECAIARARIARLQDELRRPDVDSAPKAPDRPTTGGGAP